MKYRKNDLNGDYSFGQQDGDFYTNEPAAVAQAVATRLALWKGEWFLNTQEGMDWLGQVLQERTRATRDGALRARALLTLGVTQIDNYSSSLDPATRAFRASFQLETVYGPYGAMQANFITPIASPQPGPPGRPIHVTGTAVSQTSLVVNWTPYTIS